MARFVLMQQIETSTRLHGITYVGPFLQCIVKEIVGLILESDREKS